MDAKRELIYDLLNGDGRVQLHKLGVGGKLAALNDLWTLGIVKRASPDELLSTYAYCPVCLARWRERPSATAYISD